MCQREKFPNFRENNGLTRMMHPDRNPDDPAECREPAVGIALNKMASLSADSSPDYNPDKMSANPDPPVSVEKVTRNWRIETNPAQLSAGNKSWTGLRLYAGNRSVEYASLQERGHEALFAPGQGNNQKKR